MIDCRAAYCRDNPDQLLRRVLSKGLPGVQKGQGARTGQRDFRQKYGVPCLRVKKVVHRETAMEAHPYSRFKGVKKMFKGNRLLSTKLPCCRFAVSKTDNLALAEWTLAKREESANNALERPARRMPGWRLSGEEKALKRHHRMIETSPALMPRSAPYRHCPTAIPARLKLIESAK